VYGIKICKAEVEDLTAAMECASLSMEQNSQTLTDQLDLKVATEIRAKEKAYLVAEDHCLR